MRVLLVAIVALLFAVLPCGASSELDDALIEALQGGDPAVVKSLLEKGADPNSRDEQGLSALHVAANVGSPQMALWLLDRGARVNAYATHPQVSGFTPLSVAVTSGSMEVAILLIARGADVNTKISFDIDVAPGTRAGSMKNVSLLHTAAQNGNVGMVQLLSSSGGNLDAKDGDGITPLGSAIEMDHMPIVRQLVRLGASVSAARADGSSPLHTAAQYDREEMIKFLLQYGAGVNARNNYGATALHTAAAANSEAAARVLIEHGADIHARTSVGIAGAGSPVTPLQAAELNGSQHVIKILKRAELEREGQ